MSYMSLYPNASVASLNKLAKRVNKSFSVSCSWPDYYLLKGTGPMDFIEIAHIRVIHPMTNEWAMHKIAHILSDLEDA